MPSTSWIRVRDPQTRHEFDRRADDPAVTSGHFERVKAKEYPPSPLPRRPKHHKDLASRSSVSRKTAPVKEPKTTDTEKEN